MTQYKVRMVPSDHKISSFSNSIMSHHIFTVVDGYPSVTNTHTQLALKQQVEAYVQVREEARHTQQQLEEARREEERIQRRLATKEVEQFRKRVSQYMWFVVCMCSPGKMFH